MRDDELESYLQALWRDEKGRHAQHLALRAKHTVSLTDKAEDTFSWAAPRIAAHVPGGVRLLDVGCGGGQYLGFLLQQANLVQFGIGLDRSLAIHKLYLQNQAAFTGWVALVQGDALNLPFASNSFDAAMANRMLNQTGNIAKALHEIGRVLKPGGQTFIVTADSDQPSILRESHQTALAQLGFPPYLYQHSSQPDQRFNLENGHNRLTQANFKDIALERYERLMIFEKLEDVMALYASGLIFHKVGASDTPNTNPARWRQLYSMVEAKLGEVLANLGRLEVREGAALFIGRR